MAVSRSRPPAVATGVAEALGADLVAMGPGPPATPPLPALVGGVRARRGGGGERKPPLESIHIMREAVAESERPVMLYSIGKDSSVMLHLAMEGVLPRAAAVPAAARRHDLEVPGRCTSSATDAAELGLELLVHQNPEGLELGINPFVHGSAVHTDMMEDPGAEAGARQVRLRRWPSAAPAATRRSRGPRSGSSRSARRSTAGIPSAAPRALAHLQRAQAQGREHAGVPAVELDRARRLAVHPPREDPDRAAVLRAPSGRSSSATAR